MAQDNYNYSGSFEVEECVLKTHHGTDVDLDGVLSVVSVYEDIMQGFLTANISFLDTNDLVLQNGIVGNEYCYLKLITPSSEDVSIPKDIILPPEFLNLIMDSSSIPLTLPL